MRSASRASSGEKSASPQEQRCGLAESKGRGRLLWWLLSLVLGPIATFLIVVMPRGGLRF
ncbi:hypothetical protein E3O53_14410 [Cryobacterium sp. TMT2-18-3]|nr:hypothetical protein E3O22_15680 [Cryobacterium sp. TMT2-18-2]TFC39817.1 hypothetical protein E3O18_00825 [Cryobacterium sp. TMT2-42-4]TFC54187.1 hypothetical protein E3O62_16020 [Cryobacterium sp. TMT2-15-1]TFC61215.1 hypothetical protein E3O53_14410 [Cryobacterium sp. TMT2-18-3]